MKNEEILRKAIEKAIDNGMPIETSKEAILGNNQIEFLVSIGAYYNTIFSHSFAKAFWGEEDMWHETPCSCGGNKMHSMGFDTHDLGCTRVKAERGYKFHLQQMVLENNPLSYLEKFL